jgi:protein tyrosine phosphatase (PTP) superfamily phosphohydrolase (DUF442 family)
MSQTIAEIVAAALVGANEAHLEDIAAHGIHNITNDYSDDEETYQTFADEFATQVRAKLNDIENARIAEDRAP